MIQPSLLTALQAQVNKLRLTERYLQNITATILPLAKQLFEQQQHSKHALQISFNGAQGSGKSTLVHFLKIILQHQYGLHAVTVSLDDFYLAQKQRQKLAQTIHPLLKTRGVPGTHDLELACNTLEQLACCSTQNPCFLPVFSKAEDNPASRKHWQKIDHPADIILFEGWCNQTPPQTSQQLQTPLNDLEKNHDAEGVWRHFVNEQLKEYHQKLFCYSDLMVFLQIPAFELVYQWRSLQEQKLASSTNKKTMNKQQLNFFIQHFERLTRQALDTLPAMADIVIRINNQHDFALYSFNNIGKKNKKFT